MAVEIAVPFRLDGRGHVVTVSDPDTQVRQHVFALVATHPEERAMVPGYGTNLTGLLFEDEDEVETQVTLRVQESMTRHEPGVDLISVVPDNIGGDGSANVTVNYRRLDAPDVSTIANANMAVIGVNGEVREVVRG